MRATDARKLAEESKYKIVSKKIEAILSYIKVNAQKGKFTLFLSDCLSREEKIFLQGLGYKITYIDGDFIEPGYTTISWQ